MISNTIAKKQKNKPGVAGEAISYTAPRVRESLKRWYRGWSAPWWDLSPTLGNDLLIDQHLSPPQISLRHPNCGATSLHHAPTQLSFTPLMNSPSIHHLLLRLSSGCAASWAAGLSGTQAQPQHLRRSRRTAPPRPRGTFIKAHLSAR
jgi:hypothetical protein